MLVLTLRHVVIPCLHGGSGEEQVRHTRYMDGKHPVGPSHIAGEKPEVLCRGVAQLFNSFFEVRF